jgi:hypothetical protein
MIEKWSLSLRQQGNVDQGPFLFVGGKQEEDSPKLIKLTAFYMCTSFLFLFTTPCVPLCKETSVITRMAMELLASAMCAYANTETAFIKYNKVFHIMDILTTRTQHAQWYRPLHKAHIFQIIARFNEFANHIRLFCLRLWASILQVTAVTKHVRLLIHAPFLLTVFELMDEYLRISARPSCRYGCFTLWCRWSENTSAWSTGDTRTCVEVKAISEMATFVEYNVE